MFQCHSKKILHNIICQLYIHKSGNWDSLVAKKVKRLPAMWETWVRSLGQEDPLEKEMATHSSILAWRIPWTEEPGGLYSPWGHKESDMTERLHSHFSNLEKHFFFFFHKESLGKMRTERPQNTIFLIGLHSPEQVNSLPKVIWFLISKVTVRSSW